MYRKTLITTALAVSALMLLPGCTRMDLREAGGNRSETIALDGAERAEVDLRMGPGDLAVTGGATKLMDGEFFFSDGRLEPEVDYRVSDDVGKLEVTHPNVRPWFGLFGVRSNEWDLAFADDVPLDMRISHGAGSATVELGSTLLTDLHMEAGAGNIDVDVSGSKTLEDVSFNAGAGDVTIDLSGGEALRNVDIDAGTGSIKLDLGGSRWTQDIGVTFDTGVGDVVITIPRDIGVRATIDKGVGDFNADGLRKDGDAWVNDAWGDSEVEITLDIQHGVGNVRLELE